MSYTQLLYHIVLRTHNSARTDREHVIAYVRNQKEHHKAHPTLACGATIESCLRQQ